MSKTKKFLVCVVLLCFVFVSTADAILWFLAGAIRAGVIAVSAFVSTPIGQSIVRSAVNHVIIGGVAYWYLDRGSAVPASEKYVQVTLTDTKAEAQKLKDEGKIFSDPDSGQWAVAVYSLAPPGGPYPGCSTLYWGYEMGKKWCYSINNTGTYTSVAPLGPVIGGYPNCEYDMAGFTSPRVCATLDRSGIESQKIFDDPAMKTRVQDALGRDIQRGGTLVATPVSGEPITVVGADGASKEWPSGYSEQDVASWLNSTPSTASSPSASASDIGSAVGSAVNPTLGILKTSVDGVKTSVDAIDTKLGTNPGNTTAPSYDSDYTNPTENSIADRLGSFISSNPIIGAISGSHLSLSGAVCSASVGSAFEKPLTLDFCWMESYLIMFGNVMVIFSGLTAAFIIFRRGD